MSAVTRNYTNRSMPQPMRTNVLHLIDSGGMYGAEKVVLTLLKELQGSQYPGILGCIRESESERLQIAVEAEAAGILVEYFTMKRGVNLSGLQNIRRFIEDKNLRLVHSHGYKPNILLSLLPGRNFKAVSTVHGWAKQSAGMKGRLYEFLDAVALKRMDRVIAVSKAVLKDLTERGLKNDRIDLIYNGIKIDADIPFFDRLSIRQKYGIPPDVFVIGAVGRLVQVKGHAYLIEAMPSILKERPDCRLVIAGDGPLNKDLEFLIKKLNLAGNVKLPGYVGEIEPFLAMIDLFAMPSLSEGLPISLLEAVASGKPVLASAVGGIPEVIHSSDHGILVPPADSSSIAGAVKSLFSEKDRMQRMSMVGREFVGDQFSSTVMAENYLSVYSGLTT